VIDQLQGEGTISLYTASGQEALVVDYDSTKKNLFTFAERTKMPASGVYIWVVRPSTGEGVEKGKLIILK
jgi:hypothetical protein